MMMSSLNDHLLELSVMESGSQSERAGNRGQIWRRSRHDLVNGMARERSWGLRAKTLGVVTNVARDSVLRPLMWDDEGIRATVTAAAEPQERTEVRNKAFGALINPFIF